MVAAHHQLLSEGLGVNHLRLYSWHLHGLHALLRVGETYPDFMDALMPLALPARADRGTQTVSGARW